MSGIMKNGMAIKLDVWVFGYIAWMATFAMMGSISGYIQNLIKARQSNSFSGLTGDGVLSTSADGQPIEELYFEYAAQVSRLHNEEGFVPAVSTSIGSS
jgi:hypothetical protein